MGRFRRRYSLQIKSEKEKTRDVGLQGVSSQLNLMLRGIGRAIGGAVHSVFEDVF